MPQGHFFWSAILNLKVLEPELGIYRFPPTTPFELAAIVHQPFYSLTRTPDELSVVCRKGTVFSTTPQATAGAFRAIQVIGPLDFSLTGILNQLTAPLADAQISLFSISTFDTDYILVKAEDLAQAIKVLSRNHQFV